MRTSSNNTVTRSAKIHIRMMCTKKYSRKKYAEKTKNLYYGGP